MLKLSREEYIERFIKPGIPHIFESQCGNGEVAVEAISYHKDLEYYAFKYNNNGFEEYCIWTISRYETITIIDWIEESPVVSERLCNCNIVLLMQNGCICGGK